MGDEIRMSVTSWKIPGDGPLYTPPGGPPQVERPSAEIFARMGEASIYRMCRDFYSALEASPLRPLFPPDMEEASERIGAFFVGFLGGPPRYHERFGDPRLRARHLPFPIDEQARQIWLSCFRTTLAEPARYGFPEEHLPAFLHWLEVFSGWMVNRRSAITESRG